MTEFEENVRTHRFESDVRYTVPIVSYYLTDMLSILCTRAMMLYSAFFTVSFVQWPATKG